MYAATRLLWYVAGGRSGGGGVGGAAFTAAAAAGAGAGAGLGGNGGAPGGSGCTYRNTAQLSEAFRPVMQRNLWAFDHVVVDVSHFAHALGYMTRDLVGHERDRETVKNIQRQLQGVLLRRLQPRKSLALLMDGSEPLWMLEHRRLFPGRRYDSRVYRSCASPMTYLLEERLRGTAMEQRAPPAEAVVSGPATSGLAEGKMSAFLLDLATRTVRQPTQPPHLCAPVTANDTVCLVGAPELAWLALGMTPFRNITSVTMQQGEMRCCSLQDSMEWLKLGQLLQESSNATASAGAEGSEAASESQSQRRLAAVRTDLVFLYLLCNGHETTGLPQVMTAPFAATLDAYVALERDEAAAAAQELAAQPSRSAAEGAASEARFRSFLFDEEPVTLADLDRPSLRLRLPSLQKLLIRIVRDSSASTAMSGTSGLPSGTRPTAHAATLLEIALQTHGLLCAGGVPSPAWTPTPDPAAADPAATPSTSGTALLDKFPKISVEMLLQHVTYLLNRAAAASHSSEGTHLSPQRTRTFGLTGAEVLLLTATQGDQANQIMPLYTRGHALPDGVAEAIAQTRNVHEALRKTRQALGGVLNQASREVAQLATTTEALVDAPHPALTHLPSHLFVRSPSAAARGPPPGWTYYGVHLGVKAEAMNVRYSLNASDTATLRMAD